jgi:predicted DNA-binding transcriptional regulator AlpA
MSVRFLSHADLKERGIAYSASQLHRKMKDGSFPAAVRGAGKENRWLESEIDAYVSELIAARTPRSTKQHGHKAA